MKSALILIGILLAANGLATPVYAQSTLHHWQAQGENPAKPQAALPPALEAAPVKDGALLVLPAGDFKPLRQTDSPTVDQVVDPYRLRLKDKRIVQLMDIEIPDYDVNDPGELALAAQDTLKKLLEGKQITLYQTRDADAGRVNRLGHMLAHVAADQQKNWIQGMLVVNGFARVQSTSQKPEMAEQLMKLEADARAAKRGLWKNDTYAILAPDTAMKAVGKWAIVEGRIHAAAASNNMIYLNFGPDWKNDFTIGIDATTRRQLASRAKIDALSLGSKTVRVRGWVESYNGPYIKLTSPAWLEILSEPK